VAPVNYSKMRNEPNFGGGRAKDDGMTGVFAVCGGRVTARKCKTKPILGRTQQVTGMTGDFARV